MSNILDQIERTHVDKTKLINVENEQLDPTQFEYMFTIRLQSRGKVRLQYQGLLQRLETILYAHTFDWRISYIADDDPYLVDAPCEPNLLMTDNSKGTLCIQIDMDGRPLKPETVVLIFDVFWNLRASVLSQLSFWISSCCCEEEGKDRWLLCHFNNENSFRSLAAKYSSELLHKPDFEFINILAGFIFEIISWSRFECNQDTIEERLDKIQERVIRTKS